MATQPKSRRTTPRAVAIVPAAGAGRRMGTPKLLLPWNSLTVIDSTIAAWRLSCVEQVIVVVSPSDEPLADACRAAGATVVVPLSPPADMKASLQAGIRHLRQSQGTDDLDCLLVAPADMPWIEPATIDRLVAEFSATP
ncbi:MAG: NTP transferase domain-containing protein, partial [Pirellulales bacterium]